MVRAATIQQLGLSSYFLSRKNYKENIINIFM